MQVQTRSRLAVVLARPAQVLATLAPGPDPGPTLTPGRRRGAVVADGPTHDRCLARPGDEATATRLPVPALAPLQQDPAAAPSPTVDLPVDLPVDPCRGHRPVEAALAPTTHGIREAQVPTAHGNARRLDQSPHLESGATLAQYCGLSHRLDNGPRHPREDAIQIVCRGHRLLVAVVLGMIPARLVHHRAGGDIRFRFHGLARHRLIGVAGRLRRVVLGRRKEDVHPIIFDPRNKKRICTDGR